MQTWFEVKAKYIKIDEDGRERKVSEVYLVDAVSCTDAEARLTAQLQTMVRGEFTIGKVSTSNIVEIFPHETGEYWWKAKIGIVTIDEAAGREKKINSYFLIAADDIKQSLQRLEEGLAYILIPYRIDMLVISPIVDVFLYFGEGREPIPSNLKPIVKEPSLFDNEELEEVYNSDEEPELD